MESLFKPTTNGCAKGNPGDIGGGGMLRNRSGSFVSAYYESITRFLVIWWRKQNLYLNDFKFVVEKGSSQIDVRICKSRLL